MSYKIMMIFLGTILFMFSTIDSYSYNYYQRKKLNFYSSIIKILAKDIPKDKLEKIILDSRVKFKPSLVLLNLDQPSVTHYIRHSLKKPAINKGVYFLKKHKDKFLEMEKKYQVDKEVILAILYIETNFRPQQARYIVFNAYSSLALANHPYIIKQNLARIHRKYRWKLSKSDLKKKKEKMAINSKKKATWAISELKALFKVANLMKRKILSIKGSFAGAMGYPQFLPSSYLTYAVDGNNDNFIDLFNIDDSIASIANYLKKEGFKPGDIKRQKKAIYHYNHRQEYVYVIIEYARRVKLAMNK